ncbi:MAG: GAF domain-containing protein, partial [Chloroflexi bacterium]|nr:GAF domain-containing protein [Chloroflexota bacterium]
MNIIARRGVIYGLIIGVTAILLSTAIFFISAFRQSAGVPEQILIALVLGGIATALFGPVRTGTEALVDKLFYKDRYDYRQIIQSVSTALNSVKDVTEISHLVVSVIVSTLNLAGGALFLRTQRSSFDVGATQGIFSDADKQALLVTLMSGRNKLIEFPNPATNAFSDLAFLVPLTAGGKEVGFLCVSRKASRQAFSSDDRFLLQGLAAIAAMALYGAMLLRDVSVRDTFVSVASHELRTPLTVILGYTELLLRRDPPDSTRKQWLKNIFDNSQRISSMVDDLLNVSRIQSGRINIKLDRVKLSDVLKEALTFARESTGKHEFVVDMDPDLPEVQLDRDKFGQVVGNLLSNAVKYSPAGGRITLAVRNDKGQHRVVVSVSDQGIGIEPEDKERLFTTFHRIQRPETQGIRGSGLGLYIAKEWTEAMGGKIWLESELNKGSTFFVAMPTNYPSESNQRNNA